MDQSFIYIKEINRSMGRRNLTRFLAGSAGGVLAFLLLDHLLFLGLRQAVFQWYRSTPVARDHILRRLQDAPVDYDTLLMGSSRGFQALLPVHFHELMGLKPLQVSLRGKYPRYHFYFYRQYRARFPAPNYVFYATDFHMFTIHSSNSLMRKLTADPASVVSIPMPPGNGGTALQRFSWLLYAKPHLERFLQDLLQRAKPVVPRHAWIDPYRGLIRSHIRLIRPRKYKHFMYWPFPGREGEFLIKLLEDLQRDGVKVYLVILPDYIGTFRSLAGKHRYHRDIQAICNDFPNTECLNFHDPRYFPLRRAEYFSDGGWGRSNCHMSAKGARRLTELIRLRLAGR